MRGPSMPDLFLRLIDALEEIETALERIGPLSGADVLTHLPPRFPAMGRQDSPSQVV